MSETQNESTTLSKKDLEQLLKGQFGEQCLVTRLSCEPANKVGDNYGSTLLSLEMDLVNKGTSETHYVIAKLIPPTKFLQEVFNVSVTFCKEINLYKLLYPELVKLQQECGIQTCDILNFVPKFYGSRTSYDVGESKDVDFDAVLLLGNLKKDGYKLADRLRGLDLKHCEFALNQLAAFHALVIGLREKKQNIFKKIIPKITEQFHIGPINVNEEDERKKFVETLGKNVPDCLPFVNDIRKNIMSYLDIENKSFAKEPFATLVHNDFWTNNMLFQYQIGSNKPHSLKFLDFQLTLYCSPVHDIIFFLYSSAQSYVFQNHFEYLINSYFDCFISQLKKLQCDVNVFTKSEFLKELDFFAPAQLFHILFMTSVIYTKEEEAEDLRDISSNEHLKEVGSNDLSRRKVKAIVNEFNKRGWLREYNIKPS